jgi:hypothetical protein
MPDELRPLDSDGAVRPPLDHRLTKWHFLRHANGISLFRWRDKIDQWSNDTDDRAGARGLGDAGWRYYSPATPPPADDAAVGGVVAVERAAARLVIDSLREQLAARDAEIARLTAIETAAGEAADALNEIAERTWDKRRPDECRSACNEASDWAAEARDTLRAALAAKVASEGERDNT